MTKKRLLFFVLALSRANAKKNKTGGDRNKCKKDRGLVQKRTNMSATATKQGGSKFSRGKRGGDLEVNEGGEAVLEVTWR